jgi:putative oxidoreductase
MKIASTIARYLLGLIFFVFGLNGFFHFIPMPMPPGIAGQFMGAIFVSHFYVVIFFVQTVSGLLLLIGRYVPLALALLAPVIVNILSFHAFMASDGFQLAVVAVILWLLVFVSVRHAFAGILQQRVAD